MQRMLLLVLFFLSGATALIYEIAWVRQTSLIFGVSVYAYSAVLAAYMIGLALGSYLMGRRIDAVARPLRVYAILEMAIALAAIASFFALDYVNGIYSVITNLFQLTLSWLTFVRFTLSVVVLIPATFLIGATLPIMSRVFATQVGRVGIDVGKLYLTNTAGAVVGCLLTGIFLLRLLGLTQTVFIGAALNLLISAVALWLARIVAARRDPAAADVLTLNLAKPRQPSGTGLGYLPEPEEVSRSALWFVAAGFAISGFVALGYEVVWARILYIHTSHATYSFSLMLTVFLSGLTVGSALASRWLRKHRATLAQFGVLQLGIGVLAVLALFAFANLPALPIEAVFGKAGVTRQILYELFLAFVTLFVPTVLIGAVFPIVSSLYTRERTVDVGLRIGTVNALNTLGAMIGSLAAGFVLIPLMGLQDTALALSAVNLMLGSGAIWLFARKRLKVGWVPLPVLGTATAAVVLMPAGLYLGFHKDKSEYLVFYKEGVETTVAVFEMPEDDFKVSFVNGRDEVPTDATSMRAFRLLGHLPPLLQPYARNALVLSFGNGIATGTLATHHIPVIYAVDLSPEMIEAADIYWKENYNVLRSQRLHLHIEDARNFLMQRDDQYDIITVDATHPANASSWILFTREFYELAQLRLSPEGVFMQWIPTHSMSEADYKAIIRTICGVFPHTTLWSTGGGHTFLVATPTKLDARAVVTALNRSKRNPIVASDLGPPYMISSYLMMYEDALAEYVGQGRMITDDRAFFLARR